MSTLFGIIALLSGLVYLIFFILLGATLHSINQHLGRVADHAERQTKLLASIANSAPGQQIES